MKFQLEKASDWNFREDLEIDTLEDLMKFVEESISDVIITTALVPEGYDARIKLYDDYLE